MNEGSYSGIIIPIVDDILHQFPELSFQQDNAKGHASTLEAFEPMEAFKFRESFFWFRSLLSPLQLPLQ